MKPSSKYGRPTQSELIPNIDEFSSYGVHIIPGVTDAFAAIFKDDGKSIFDYEEVTPVKSKQGYRGYVPWGEDNLQPETILTKIRADEVMSSNMWFNIQTAYGMGFKPKKSDDSKITDADIKKFFRRNNMVKYWAEQFTDIKHFYFSVLVIIIDQEGKTVAQIRHKEAVNVRFETCNPETGKIENIFYANWKNTPKEDDIEAIPLLDEDDPVGDLMVRLGREPNPQTGNIDTMTTDRKFAIVNRIPTPGQKYYPFAYYFSTFNSGWASLKAMIPVAKIAKMTNGMVIKYLVELHKDYFTKLFSSENISDPEKKKARKAAEINNIKNFLSGIDNQNKSWFSTYYIDPNGKEQCMVRIERLDKDKEGGDYIEDSEEAANIVSYAMGVHPSLIGSSPGANKSINGTEARELFTMKQALEHLTRDIMLGPFYLLNDVNGWDLDYDIPDLLLSTLDKKTDAIPSNDKKLNPDDSKNTD
ncbi:MAG: hypothetical protein ACOYMF_05560 [Bacteroidales bacterium]